MSGRPVTPPIESAADACTAFETLLTEEASFIRFEASRIPKTRGGWLYRLQDLSAVVGLSGDSKVSPRELESALNREVAGGVIYSPGEGPPPETRAQFIEKSKERKWY